METMSHAMRFPLNNGVCPVDLKGAVDHSATIRLRSTAFGVQFCPRHTFTAIV